jgi:uncharacterized protein (TIGR00369 family)
MSELTDFGRAAMEKQGFSVHLGARLTEMKPGVAEIELDVGDHLLQQNGFVHGGVIAYLVDCGVSFAGGSVLGPNVLTQEYKISFLRPASGPRLVARGTVVHQSKRQAVSRCDVFVVGDGTEKLCATALGTMVTSGERVSWSP